MASRVVRGIDEVNRAFALAGAEFHKEKNTRLKLYAQPVARDAEILAQGRIRRVGLPWSQMRVGATTDLVYVAPVQRGTKIPLRKRRNLARLLLNRAMVPALEKNRTKIASDIDGLLARMERRFNSGN